MADGTPLLGALTRFARTMADSYDVSDVLFGLTTEVADVLGTAGAGIAVADESGALRCATASGDGVAELERVQEEHQSGPCVTAHRSQTAVAESDISTIADWPAYRATAEQLGFTSVAGIPLSLRAEHFGALNVYDRGHRPWSDDDLATARVLADMAAAYLVQDQLADAHTLTAQLQAALDGRVLIEQAKGVLAGESAVSVDVAFDRMREHARTTNTKLKEVARRVVEEGFRP